MVGILGGGAETGSPEKNKNTSSSYDPRGWERKDRGTVGVIGIRNWGGRARRAGAQASALGTFLAACERARKGCDEKSSGAAGRKWTPQPMFAAGPWRHSEVMLARMARGRGSGGSPPPRTPHPGRTQQDAFRQRHSTTRTRKMQPRRVGLGERQ